MKAPELTARSRRILSSIAEGRSYDQILGNDNALTYHDIFSAAAEALELAERSDSGSTYEERMIEIRKTYPRAYEKWSEEEDAQLTELHGASTGNTEIGRSCSASPAPFAVDWPSSVSLSDRITVRIKIRGSQTFNI